MVPESFHEFFVAAAGASGALVGLMFVAISVTRQNPLEAEARAVDRVRASSALISLLTPLLLALIALLPGTGFGKSSAIIGALGILYAASAVRRLATAGGTVWERVRSVSILVGFVAVMVVDVLFGIVLWVRPDDSAAVDSIAVTVIASIGLGISRAWELVGGQATSALGSIGDLVRRDHRD